MILRVLVAIASIATIVGVCLVPITALLIVASGVPRWRGSLSRFAGWCAGYFVLAVGYTGIIEAWLYTPATHWWSHLLWFLGLTAFMSAILQVAGPGAIAVGIAILRHDWIDAVLYLAAAFSPFIIGLALSAAAWCADRTPFFGQARHEKSLKEI